MVKELIKSIIGKKDKTDDSKDDDIPDELPALAEDIAASPDAAVTPPSAPVTATPPPAPAEVAPVASTSAPATPEAAPSLEVPADLANISQDPPPPAAPTPAPEEAPHELDSIPQAPSTPESKAPVVDAIANTDTAMPKQVQQLNSTTPDSSIQTPKGIDTDILQTKSIIEERPTFAQTQAQPPEDEASFFNTLLKITSKQGVNKKLLTGNLYKRMENFHSLKSPEQIQSLTKDEIVRDIKHKLEELNINEANWKHQKEIIEKNKQILTRDEQKVKDKIDELEPILKRLTYYEEAPSGKYFKSNEGIIARTVFELLGIIKVMDPEIFNHHFNEEKNDFVTWIRDVINDTELAEKMEKTNSQKELTFILENAFNW